MNVQLTPSSIYGPAWLLVGRVQRRLGRLSVRRAASAASAYLYPSLLLALGYIGLLACIYAAAPPDKKTWSLIALCVGVLYAAMASINYNIQLVAVRQSLLAGETDGTAMFPQANPHSIFWALATLTRTWACPCSSL